MQTKKIPKEVIFAKPVLNRESQLGFRIGLARKRSASYPLDSMNFIMIDLERPELNVRHAHQCAEDLTGRLLEFLSCADGIDGINDERLPELFERILNQRRASGLFGRYAGANEVMTIPPEESLTSGHGRLAIGLISYYESTGDWRALESAVGIADRIWKKWNECKRCNSNWGFAAEPMAKLYHITGNKRYLEVLEQIRDDTVVPPKKANGVWHQLTISRLRGLQLAALYTGDSEWMKMAEPFRDIVHEKHIDMPDGNIPESIYFNGDKHSRTEGCAIAEWLMLHLNFGLLSGKDEMYDEAEKILWNALFFNQFVNGGFGLRGLIANGYSGNHHVEAWCCCLEHAGLAMTEVARHTVVLHDKTLRVNFLIPGTYTVNVPGHGDITVTIRSNYPETADAIVEVSDNLPAGISVRIRIPNVVRDDKLTEERKDGRRKFVLKGRVGHHLETIHDGDVVLKYGPLVLAPPAIAGLIKDEKIVDDGAPIGFNGNAWPDYSPELLVGKEDTDGFVNLSNKPIPNWVRFEEGPLSRCGVGEAAVNVPVRFKNGKEQILRFHPLCSYTSFLELHDVPLVFRRSGSR